MYTDICIYINIYKYKYLYIYSTSIRIWILLHILSHKGIVKLCVSNEGILETWTLDYMGIDQWFPRWGVCPTEGHRAVAGGRGFSFIMASGEMLFH